ncbi:transposase family protein [Cylindrospermum stagnale PCC 7417]|uniref:Transposase family protein n=1 Tax=Cylindrospermum stagnale PCC 7417 TaxID=56107 RepID=K9WUY1_9NOST|nr:transposase [Cylindrospermum stagnale]AFZ24023.1 transposase family protein [Cylindrospermum stagnale PCC 7417]
MQEPRLKIYQRTLPHWELDGATYFITFNTWEKLELSPEEREIVFNSCLFFNKKRYQIFVFVVMADHVHLLIQPLFKSENCHQLQKIILSSSKPQNNLTDYTLSCGMGILRQAQYKSCPPLLLPNLKIISIIKSSLVGWASCHWCQVKKNGFVSREGNLMVEVNTGVLKRAMSKPRKKQGNPDFRHRVNVPAPASEEIESRLFELVSPGTFTNLKEVKDKERSLRSRVLTLPVMAAIVLSIVYRQVQHLTDVLRILEVEGLMWVEATKVSKQALSQRLNSLPAHLFAKLLEQVIECLAAKRSVRELAPAWASVSEKFPAIWIGDASTLEAMKKHFGQLQEKTGAVLAGKMLMVVEAFTHTPVAVWYDADVKRNETRWWQALLERLPSGGLLVVDMGFYGFEWFDSLTTANKYVLTRQKEKV